MGSGRPGRRGRPAVLIAAITGDASVTVLPPPTEVITVRVATSIRLTVLEPCAKVCSINERYNHNVLCLISHETPEAIIMYCGNICYTELKN